MRIDENDLRLILEEARPSWEELRNSRVFITGGTGFFGTWLLESFAAANREFGLEASALVLSRNPGAFLDRLPHLREAGSIRFLEGDARRFDFPSGRFTHVIHAATESSIFVDAGEPLERLEAIIDSVRHVLRFTAQSRAHSFLLTSTGGIYGKQPPEISHVPESFSGSPSPISTSPSASMGEGKRVSELLACLHGERAGFAVKIARCFAFSGPHLPLDRHYAIGNFMGDVLARRPVRVRGDGTPVRSYLYASELTAWLWQILVMGPPGEAFNVGSENEISIRDLARIVAGFSEETLPVEIEQAPKPGDTPARYVPSTRKARELLGLRQTIPLEEGIKRTLSWHRKRLDWGR